MGAENFRGYPMSENNFLQLSMLPKLFTPIKINGNTQPTPNMWKAFDVIKLSGVTWNPARHTLTGEGAEGVAPPP